MGFNPVQGLWFGMHRSIKLDEQRKRSGGNPCKVAGDCVMVAMAEETVPPGKEEPFEVGEK